MLVLNFTHPLMGDQLDQLSHLIANHVREQQMTTVPVELDLSADLVPQVQGIVSTIALSPDQWQQEDLIVNLPGMAPAAAVLLAEIHGRSGHFPRLMRLAKANGQVAFRVVEVVDLDEVRAQARRTR